MKQLIHKKGNLLTDQDVRAIGHQTNIRNTFGAGIARQIKEMYPVAYEADTAASKSGNNHLGQISYAGVLRNSKSFAIFNLYGQDLYGEDERKTNYEALYSALEKMRRVCDSSSLIPKPSVGFPKFMGAGLGGGKWEIVERLIEVAFDGYTGDVYIIEWDGK